MAEQKKLGCLGCLVFIVGVPLLIILFLMLSPADPGSVERNQKASAQIAAYAQAKKAVLEKLKAPTTADFGGYSVKEEEAGYTVAGYIDAQNSFGSKIRSRYIVKLEKGSWRILSAVVW